MPFLVDSVTHGAGRARHRVHVLVHPVIAVTRDDKGGKLAGVGEGPARIADAPGDRSPGRRRRHALRSSSDIARRLADVRASSPTGRRCATRCVQIADELATAPMPRRRRRRARGAGVPALGRRRPFHLPRLPRIRGRQADGERSAVPRSKAAAWACCAARTRRQAAPADGAGRASTCRQARSMDPLILTKTNARSTVHRPGYMDYIGVLQFDANGRADRASSASSACTPPAPTTAARGTSRWCASATST